MGNKFGYYTINLPLDDVWNRTLTFWANYKGRITEESSSSNNLLRNLIFKHKATFSSYGEIYRMNFGFNPKDSYTYVSVEVSLAFGYGMQWLKPQGIMKNWAHSVGVIPIKLVRKVDKKFLSIFDEIQKAPPQQKKFTSALTKHCPQCNAKNNVNSNFCIQCGAKFGN